MGIQNYIENGVTYYQVSITIRSKKDRSIRVQRQITGLKSHGQAIKAEEELKESVLREVIEKETAEVSWGKLVDMWEMALRNGEGMDRIVGKTTIEDYIQALHTHTKVWWRRPADEINRGDVRALYQEIAIQGLSKAVADKLRSAINGLFAWAIDTRKVRGISQSPAIGIPTRLIREEEKRPEILTLTQIRQLLEYAKTSQHPWYPIWAMALLTGMRAGELCALRWESVDLENKLIHVQRSWNKRKNQEGPTKGRYWRDVPINHELETLFLELRSKQHGMYVLPRIRDLLKGEQARVIREFCMSVGLPSIRFHTLRACFATQLLAGGVAVPTVMSVGGWKGIKAMQCYLRLAGVEIRGATEGLKILPPRDAVKVVSLFGQSDLG